MFEVYLQIIPEIISEEGFSIGFKIASYIITVIIGGVGFKFLKLWFEHSTDNDNFKETAGQNFINNLTNEMGVLRNRVSELEKNREASYERELESIKALAKSEQEVENLKYRIKNLERHQKVLEDTLDKYYKQFGPLSNETA